jgi:phosphatidylglycerophosphate synthase
VGRIAELRRTVQRKSSNLYDTLFTRRVSIYLTAALAPTRVTANQVSAFAALVGLGACALIAFGAPAGQLGGVALIHLYAVLDSVDGELARLRKSFTLRGLFIEDLSAYAMINGFNLAVAWYLRRAGHGDWPLAAAVALAAFGRNAMPVARRVILNAIAAGRKPTVVPRAARPPGRLRAFVEEQLLYQTNIWVVVSTLIVVEIVLGRPAGVVPVFALAIGGLLLKELAVVAHLVRGEALERQLADATARAAAAGSGQGTGAPR